MPCIRRWAQPDELEKCNLHHERRYTDTAGVFLFVCCIIPYVLQELAPCNMGNEVALDTTAILFAKLLRSHCIQTRAFIKIPPLSEFSVFGPYWAKRKRCVHSFLFLLVIWISDSFRWILWSHCYLISWHFFRPHRTKWRRCGYIPLSKTVYLESLLRSDSLRGLGC